MGFFNKLIKDLSKSISNAGKIPPAPPAGYNFVPQSLAQTAKIQQLKSKTPIAPPVKANPTPIKPKTKITPFPTPALSPIEKATHPTFDKLGIPREIAYGIANAEGGNIGKNNLYNMNATDSNPTGAYDYASPQAAATDSAKLMRKMIDKSGAGKKSADEQLKAIEDAGFAGDPKTWKQRSMATGGAGKVYNSWSDFVKATKGWQKWRGVKY